MNARDHWDRAHATRAERERSWFEPVPEVSLRLMESAGLTTDTCVIDVGGGDSHLVDALLGRGLRCLSVLDLSRAALDRARSRLGSMAEAVRWIEADVTGDWSSPPVDIWHDRALLHFLVEARDRRAYVDHLRNTLLLGGSAIIAMFAPSGPDRCSGLPVKRETPGALAEELGADFDLVESVEYTHPTPWGALQAFCYTRLVRTHGGPTTAGSATREA